MSWPDDSAIPHPHHDIAFILHFVTEIQNQFPVFSGQILVRSLVCTELVNYVVISRQEGLQLLTDDLIVRVWLAAFEHWCSSCLSRSAVFGR